MIITMISAIAESRVIATGHGGIPWHLPRDTQYFREFTAGKHLLLGRRTFEEMAGWFVDHTPIILTTNENYRPSIGIAVGCVDEAIAKAGENGASELAVCGGASVYAAALPYADELFLTKIEAEIDGTAQFPDYLSEIEWETVSTESFPPDAENDYSMTFVHLRRIAPSSQRPARLKTL